MLNYSYCSDKYQYTMGKSFFQTGRKDVTAVFNMFYRKAPENNNWAVCSGTEEVIECVLNLGKAEPSFFEKFLVFLGFSIPAFMTSVQYCFKVSNIGLIFSGEG